MNNLVYSENEYEFEKTGYIDDDFAVLTDEALEDIPLLDNERLILRFHE